MGSTAAADNASSAQQTSSKASSDDTSVPPFSYYSNAQSDFKPPLIANNNAFLGDVFSTSDIGREHPLSAGFYRLEPGPELVYTYTYDEMKILVEGDMQIAQLKSAEEKEAGLVKEEVEAKKGDTFFFPKGAVVRFRTREGGLAWFCGGRARDGA
ncbi:MAG: hypothetical protein LQ338_004521 [Usnochroma carphineum]|nr:MAG: hypothetical protein LQ338_004521 [Usnochroma carphineum]